MNVSAVIRILLSIAIMFVVWSYLYESYWDVFGFRVVIQIYERHVVPRVIGPRRDRLRHRPSQLASTYG